MNTRAKRIEETFVGGHVLEVHSIGRYDIVEYENTSLLTGEPEDILFHPYFDGQDTNVSYNSLEEALVAAVAFGSLPFGEAGTATIYACRILNF